MTDHDLLGRLVYLTVHADRWLRERNPVFNVLMANRVARVIKVFDWDTEEGKYLLRLREHSGKWRDLDPKEFKFVLSIYYPELVRDGKAGIMVEEVFPRTYPGQATHLFEPLPPWMELELQRWESKDRTFRVAEGKKDEKGKERRVSRRVRR